MLGLADGHMRKAVVSRQLLPAARSARTARRGAPRRHATSTTTAGLVEVTAANAPRRWGALVPALLQKSGFSLVLRQSSSKGNPEGRRAGSSELPDNYEAILIGAAAPADTTAAGDADGVTAMKRLCGSVS
ncbi:hypothetical protein TcCL_ESM11466 [Trypanosoma cruzi]|nr:hypothetical protein TcCL_ESM11466 [Trypanosoma cruzi]